MTFFALGILALLWTFVACLHIWQAARFSRVEGEWRERFSQLDAEWRERERTLIDRLLGQAKIAPVAPLVEVENVVKWPDPEVFLDDWGSQTVLREDSIKELVEMKYPGLAHLSAIELRAQHAREWQEAERRYVEETTPLRAA